MENVAIHQQNKNDEAPRTEDKQNEKWRNKFQYLSSYHEDKFGYRNISQNEQNGDNIDVLTEKSPFEERKPLKEKRTITTTQAVKKNQEKWDKKFQELMTFKEEFGHCKIPNTFKEYRSLRNWLGKQREAYKAYHSSGKGVLNAPKRIQKLRMIGVSLEPYSTNWNSKFQELILFQREHGHCRVPQQGKSKYKRLGQWLGRQKKDLIPSSEMRNGNLSFTHKDMERAQLLESVGVCLREGWSPMPLLCTYFLHKLFLYARGWWNYQYFDSF